MPDFRDRFAHLLDELKRRGVLRVAAVYLVGAWLAIQVSDITFPRLGLPDWTVTFVIILLAALFPLVVAVSWVFDLTRTGPRRIPDLEREIPDGAAMVIPARVRTRVPVILAGMMTLPLIGFGLWWANDARAADLDPQLVAVMPFRVAGAAADLTYLREGLMDLIAARVGSGADGLRVVAPRAMSRSLREELGSVDADPSRDEALDMALSMGAGRLLQGEIIGSAQSVTVSATLYDVRSGRVLASRPFPPVPADSLHALVDEIATQLIAAESGLRPDRLAAITTRSVPALRAFIEAEHAFRRGEHARAVAAYDQAVQLDTTFTLAALGLLRSGGWAIGTDAVTTVNQARRIVRRGAEGLGDADRAFFDVFDRQPGEFQRDRLEKALRAAQRHPNQADLSYLAGDRLLHYGLWVGVEDAVERARRELERTVAMDSSYGEPLIHLMEIAVSRADTAGMRRYGDLLLAIDSAGPYATRVRYVRALGLDGSRNAPQVRLDTLSNEQLGALAHIGWSVAPRQEVVDEIERRWRATTLPEEVRRLGQTLEYHAMRGGRPSLQAEIDARLDRTNWSDVDGMLRAIYWHRDPEQAERYMSEVRARLEEMRRRDANPERIVMRECLIGHYAVAAGDVREATRVVGVLEGWETPVDAEDGRLDHEVQTCALYVRAGAAVHAREADAARRVTLIDDHLKRGPAIDEFIGHIYLLGIARLWETLDERERALAVVRRRVAVPWAVYWVNELNAEQARLADALGHREEAIGAYQAYLSHMVRPEPPFDERAARARARLSALVGESRN